MIEGNTHSLMTVIKYCLVEKYSYKFTKASPDKREIIKAIFSISSDKLKYRGLSWEDILESFYKEEASRYDNLSIKRIKKIRKKNLALTRALCEGSSVTPSQLSNKY